MNRLVLHCGGYSSHRKLKCRKSVEVTLPIERDPLTRFLAEGGWIVSVVSPPGSSELTMDILCPGCAREIYSPAFVAQALAMVKSGEG
jgi:hypothetical protein